MTDNAAPQPRIRNDGKTFAAPVLYPRMLRQVCDALDALIAFEAPDDTHQESAHYVTMGGGPLPIYDEELEEEGKPLANLVGWLAQYDKACWVFVPYIPMVEDADS